VDKSNLPPKGPDHPIDSIGALPHTSRPSRVGRLAPQDLPQVTEFRNFVAALAPERRDDLTFTHAPKSTIAMEPEIVGRNVFGSASKPTKPNPYPTREVASILLNDGLYSGNSLAILDARNRLLLPAIENVGSIEHLASYDPIFQLNDGELCLAPDAEYTTTSVDEVIVPVCGAGSPNYGHYLFDGIGPAFMLTQLLPPGAVRVAGQTPRPWQKDILDALRLSDGYIEIHGPVRFRKMIATTTLALHVSFPTGFARPVFDVMRFYFGASARPTRALFVSRRNFGHRLLTNREEIEALAEAMGLELVEPERLTVEEQVRLFASAKVVVAEAGAALANVGFCSPGALVMEIQTAAFGDGWIRSTCHFFSHRWHLFRAANVKAPPGVELAFRIDPEEFRAALATVLARAASE
jgi:capsular polysaccharide biosynthesis protein